MASPPSTPPSSPSSRPSWVQVVRDWVLALLVAIVIFVGSSVILQKLSPQNEVASGPAPSFAVETLDHGPFSLSSVAGDIVVLNFWATWCGPCRAEMPELSRFARDYPTVHLVGIAVDSGSAADIARFTRQLNMHWPVAVAPEGLQDAYDVRVLPTTVVIDREGQLFHRHIGQLSYSDLVAHIP